MYFCTKIRLSMIRFFSNEIGFNLSSKNIVKEWIKRVVTSYGYKLGDVNVIFCSDEYLLQINKDYLNHNYYTDIITFDYSEEGRIAGELYISIDTVLANAAEYNQERAAELLRVIIHGFLHLMQFNDQSPEEEAEMHSKEDAALSLFDFSTFNQTF